MTTDTRYNGWTNYETWAVKLWIDNDHGSYDFWNEQADEVIEECGDKFPNAFADEQANRRIMLASRLKEHHEEGAEQFMANQASVFADLMNSALGSVNWHEIAESLLEHAEERKAA
jgi:hypothetical protein